MKVEELAIKDLRPSASLARKTMDPEGLKELSDNILESGLTQPIKVRPMGDGYEIIYGHRRTKASEMAGLKTIKAIVDDVDDRTAYLMQLVENEHREKVPELERARSWKKLKDEEGLTYSELAKIVGYRSPYVETVLRGLDAYDAGIGALSLRKLAKVNSVVGTIEEKKVLAKKIADEKLTRDQTNELVRSYTKRHTPVERAIVLETKYSKDPSITFEQALKARSFERLQEQKRQKIVAEVNDPVVKEFIRCAKEFTKEVKLAQKYHHKFPRPDSIGFVDGQSALIIKELQTLKELLTNA
jgi:ParB family chromosome partitioning protein